MSNWTDLVLIHGNEEGARAAFEKACEIIIRYKHPTQNVNAIRVHGGDGGIDVYVGELGVSPILVYQCKYFIREIGESQKSQIRDSYKAACTNESFAVKAWYLCTPINFSVPEAQWFDGWSAKQAVSASRIPPADLLQWAEELGLASTIFNRHDSLKLDEILFRLTKESRDSWADLLEQAEADCYKILLTLLRAHLRCLDGKYAHLEDYGKQANAGDRLDTCQYFKSAIAGSLAENEKVWIFSLLSDFTLEPIAYRFIRRYDELVEKAKTLGRSSELSTSEFYSTWNMFRSPQIRHLRDQAGWTVAFS